MISTNYCDLRSLTKPHTARPALCSCVKMDSWLIKQSGTVQTDIDTSDANRSAGDGVAADTGEG